MMPKQAIKAKLRPIYRKAKEVYKLCEIKYRNIFRPITLVLDVTYNCCLNCITCRCNSIAKYFPANRNLTMNEYRKVIESFSQIGGKNLVVSGGEPLLARHLYSILELAHNLGLTTYISTNGILLTNEVVEKLVTCKLDYMTVSVDGTGSAYESIRGEHNFEKLCSSLGSLNACEATRSMNIGFHVTVSINNVHNISSILSLAKEHHVRNVTFAYVSRLPEDVNQQTKSLLHTPFHDELNHWSLPDDIFIKEDQFQVLESEVEAIKEESKVLGIVCGIDPALDRNQDKRDLLTGRFPLKKRCFAPWETILVGPDGTLTACPMLTHSPLANIRESELSDYWQNNQMLNHIRNILIEHRYLPVCYYCCGHGSLL